MKYRVKNNVAKSGSDLWWSEYFRADTEGVLPEEAKALASEDDWVNVSEETFTFLRKLPGWSEKPLIVECEIHG